MVPEADLVNADYAEPGVGGGGHRCGEERHPAKGNLCEAAASHTGPKSPLLFRFLPHDLA